MELRGRRDGQDERAHPLVHDVQAGSVMVVGSCCRWAITTAVNREMGVWGLVQAQVKEEEAV